jgi:hypothetical protein
MASPLDEQRHGTINAYASHTSNEKEVTTKTRKLQ